MYPYPIRIHSCHTKACTTLLEVLPLKTLSPRGSGPLSSTHCIKVLDEGPNSNLHSVNPRVLASDISSVVVLF